MTQCRFYNLGALDPPGIKCQACSETLKRDAQRRLEYPDLRNSIVLRQYSTVSSTPDRFVLQHYGRQPQPLGRLPIDRTGNPPQVPPDVASRTIDFVYDPDIDTADDVAEELGNQFNLSSTDRDICAAALKEWLAKELPTNS